MKKIDYIQFIIIDLFCGAGGTTLGFEMTDSSWENFNNFLKAQGIDAGAAGKEKFFKMCQVIAGINHDYTAIVSHHVNNKNVLHFNENIIKLYGFKVGGVLLTTAEFMRLLRLIENVVEFKKWGNKAKKYIGNAVHPLVPKAMAERINKLLAA